MPDLRSRRALQVLGGILAALLALGSGVLAAGLDSAIGWRLSTGQAVQSGAGSGLHTPGPPAAASDGWWKPLPTAQEPFVPVQIVVEKLQVQAPIEVKGVDSQNVMQPPDKPGDAAWYRFTARPGSGGNAVFSGHRDFVNAGPAIFWHLDQLAAGDLVDVVSSQQTEIRYRVRQTWDYPVASMPMKQVLAADPVDEVTLITSSGSYTPGSGYDHRLVVRAVRVG